jgi:hypothetical protein
LNPNDFDTVYKDVIMMAQSKWKELLEFVYGDPYSQDNSSKKGLKSHDTLSIWVEFDILFKNF